MEKEDAYQLIEKGEMTKSAVEEFLKSKLTPSERENQYCEWLPKVAVGKLFGDEPNKSLIVALRCIERLRTEPEPEEQNDEREQAQTKTGIEEPGINTTLEIANRQLFDVEQLRLFFVERFFADDYKERETHKCVVKLSRFDMFIEHFTDVLNEKANNKTIGGIALLIHESPLAQPKYKRRNKFSETCRCLFKCCGKEIPKELGKAKYSPKKELIELFEELK